jgi:hypothetical protein
MGTNFYPQPLCWRVGNCSTRREPDLLASLVASTLPQVGVVSTPSKLLCLQRQPPGTYPYSSHNIFSSSWAASKSSAFRRRSTKRRSIEHRSRHPFPHRQLAWRQHSRPRLLNWLTLRSPSGTLGTRVATRVTMRVAMTTP